MNKAQQGCQTIGCRVTNCRYNRDGSYCELSRIEVEPCTDKPDTGRPEDESLCGSYKAR